MFSEWLRWSENMVIMIAGFRLWIQLILKTHDCTCGLVLYMWTLVVNVVSWLTLHVHLSGQASQIKVCASVYNWTHCYIGPLMTAEKYSQQMSQTWERDMTAHVSRINHLMVVWLCGKDWVTIWGLMLTLQYHHTQNYRTADGLVLCHWYILVDSCHNI